VKEEADPSWVLNAPQVAQDLKRVSHYWTHPLQHADYDGALDAKARAPQSTKDAQQPHPREAEHGMYRRPYFEMREPGVMAQAATAAPTWSGGAGPFGWHQSAAMVGQCQPQIGLLHGGAPAASGGFCTPSSEAWRLDPAPPLGISADAASGLAARLECVIVQLEGGDRSAISDLREIEATYNAARQSRLC